MNELVASSISPETWPLIIPAWVNASVKAYISSVDDSASNPHALARVWIAVSPFCLPDVMSASRTSSASSFNLLRLFPAFWISSEVSLNWLLSLFLPDNASWKSNTFTLASFSWSVTSSNSNENLSLPSFESRLSTCESKEANSERASIILPVSPPASASLYFCTDSVYWLNVSDTEPFPVPLESISICRNDL